MDERWYIKTRAGVVGPRSFADLSAMLADGRLDEHARVRLGIGGKWRPIKEALSDPRAAAGTTAAQLIAEADRAAIRRAADGEVSRFSPIAPVSYVLDRLQSAGAGLMAAALSLLTSIARLIGRRAIFGLSLACTALALILSLPESNPSPYEMKRALATIWDEARAFRDSSESSGDWDGFTRHALDQLEELANSLDREDTHWHPLAFMFGDGETTRWARLEVIQLAKNDLPAALRAGPDGLTRYEPLIERRMARIDRIVKDSPTRNRGSKTPVASEWGKSNTAIVLILSIEAVLLAGAVFFWRRRRLVA